MSFPRPTITPVKYRPVVYPRSPKVRDIKPAKTAKRELVPIKRT